MILVGKGKIEIKSDKQILKEANEREMNYECNSCGAKFHDTDQTRDQQRNGICPACGDEDIIDTRDALWTRMRDLSDWEARGMLCFLSGRLDMDPQFWAGVEAYVKAHTPVIDLSQCKTGTEAKQKLAAAVLEQEAS